MPVAPLLLELLGFSELNKAPMATKNRPPDFSLVLRVAKQELRSPAVQEVIVEGALQLLAAHLNQWAYSPAFPELAHVPSRDLRRFCKATQVTRFRKAARAVVDAAEPARTDCAQARQRRLRAGSFDPARARSSPTSARRRRRWRSSPAQLLDKERQRIAAMQATDVTLTRGGRGSDGTSDSDDDEDDDDVRRSRDEAEDDEFDDDEDGSRGGGDDDDDDDDDEFDGMEDEDVLAALASRAGAAGGTAGGLTVRPTLPPKRAAAEGDEDVVEDLVFSDDEEPAKKKKKKRRF